MPPVERRRATYAYSQSTSSPCSACCSIRRTSCSSLCSDGTPSCSSSRKDRTKAHVVDADTGEPIIRRVVKIRDHMDGEHLNILPDLAIQWNVSTPTHCITSPRIGEIETEIPRWRTGEHLPQGFLLSTAPGVVPGEINSIVRAEDLAPTVCRLLDVHIPNVDGSPIEEMLPRH